MTSPADENEIEPANSRRASREVQSQYQIQLNDNAQLVHRLESFKSDCQNLESERKRSCKKLYYELGLIARITKHTSFEDMSKLLANGTLTFFYDTVRTKPEELKELVSNTHSAIDVYQSQQPRKQIVSGLAFEINGDSCRLGRLRNDCSIMLSCGDIITLTTDEAYKNCCYKEVSYVRNLKYYLQGLDLRDIIKIGEEVIGRVIKKLSVSIALLIVQPGLINSYEFLALPRQCSKCTKENLISMFQGDLEWVSGLEANYIVLPKLRCKSALVTLRTLIEREFKSLKVIGQLDLSYIDENKLDLYELLKHLDYLWIPEYFQKDCCIQAYIGECVLPMAKYLRLPIICSVPLNCCKQVERYTSHPFLELLDALYIEKSEFCCKYPSIVRKFLPVSKYVCDKAPNCVSSKGLTTKFQTKVNYIIGVLSTIECQAIFLHMDAAPLMEALRRVEIHSPMYVVLPWDSLTNTEEDLECILQLARALNLRRNTRSIIYTSNMNEFGYSPIGYGIDYVRQKGCIQFGELIVTVQLFKNTIQNEDAGDSEDVALLQAFYLQKPDERGASIIET